MNWERLWFSKIAWQSIVAGVKDTLKDIKHTLVLCTEKIIFLYLCTITKSKRWYLFFSLWEQKERKEISDSKNYNSSKTLLSLIFQNFHLKDMLLNKSLERTTKSSTFICPKGSTQHHWTLLPLISRNDRDNHSTTQRWSKKICPNNRRSKKLSQYWTFHLTWKTLFRYWTCHPINDNLSITCHSCYHCKKQIHHGRHKSKLLSTSTTMSIILVQDNKTFKCLHFGAHDKSQVIVFILK